MKPMSKMGSNAVNAKRTFLTGGIIIVIKIFLNLHKEEGNHTFFQHIYNTYINFLTACSNLSISSPNRQRWSLLLMKNFKQNVKKYVYAKKLELEVLLAFNLWASTTWKYSSEWKFFWLQNREKLQTFWRKKILTCIK